MGHVHYMKAGDLLPELCGIARGPLGDPVAMTASMAASGVAVPSSVVLHLRASGAASWMINAAATWREAASGAGALQYTWATPLPAGFYQAEFEVMFAGSRALTFPNRGFTSVIVSEAGV
jgi:hypothetical protein